MNEEIRRTLECRARGLFPYLADHLANVNPASFEESHGYRYCFLLIKGPKEFLKTFIHDELHLDEAAIEAVFWATRGEIPGPHGLMNEERALVALHNHAVDEWLAKNDRILPTITDRGRQVITLLR